MVNQLGSPLAQPIQAGAVLRLDTHASVHREAAGWVKCNARWRCRVGGDVTPQRLKHPIDRTNMEVHMGVQARPKPVDEGHRTDMHRRLVKLGSPWAVAQQALLDDPRIEPQRTVQRPRRAA